MADVRAIVSDRAPAAIGAYSQAVVASGLVFCSGQIALDAGGQLVGEGDVAAQTRQVLANLGAVLEAAGSSWHQVVKSTIFLAEMADFATVNELYGAVLGETKPARACVAVATLPRNVLVEIDVVAAV